METLVNLETKMDFDKDKVVEDADADTKDVETTEKTDEEQTVKDTDADTRDVENNVDTVLHDVMSKIDNLSREMNDRFDSYAKLLIDSGATVTQAQSSVSEEPAREEKVETLTDLDYNL